MEKLLLENGISICHPMPANTITSDRNKEAYEKDLELNYHPRGSCKNDGGCIIYKLFGDLGVPGKLIIPSVYFYPANSGSSNTKNQQKIFGSVGTGRLEISRNSPRARNDSTQPFMTTESIVGVMIEAPFNIVLRDDSEQLKALILKTLEYLFEKVSKSDYPFLLGGNRGFGYGRAVAVFLNNSGNYLIRDRNCLGIKNEKVEEINQKFEELIEKEKGKFPIDYNYSKKKEKSPNNNGKEKDKKKK